MIGALVQLYREQARYLERIYKWTKRVGAESIKKQVVEDKAKRRALYERFVVSQSFVQTDSPGPNASRARTPTNSRRCRSHNAGSGVRR